VCVPVASASKGDISKLQRTETRHHRIELDTASEEGSILISDLCSFGVSPYIIPDKNKNVCINRRFNLFADSHSLILDNILTLLCQVQTIPSSLKGISV